MNELKCLSLVSFENCHPCPKVRQDNWRFPLLQSHYNTQREVRAWPRIGITPSLFFYSPGSIDGPTHWVLGGPREGKWTQGLCCCCCELIPFCLLPWDAYKYTIHLQLKIVNSYGNDCIIQNAVFWFAHMFDVVRSSKRNNLQFYIEPPLLLNEVSLNITHRYKTTTYSSCWLYARDLFLHRLHESPYPPPKRCQIHFRGKKKESIYFWLQFFCFQIKIG